MNRILIILYAQFFTNYTIGVIFSNYFPYLCFDLFIHFGNRREVVLRIKRDRICNAIFLYVQLVKHCFSLSLYVLF